MYELGKQFYGLIDLGYRPSQAYAMILMCTPSITQEQSTWLFELAGRCELDTVTWPIPMVAQ